MKKWLLDGGDISQIVNDAISWHATLAHNKSDYIPGEYQSEIERLVMKLGFRLVLKNIDYDKIIEPASTSTIKLDWENLGIAPPYRDHRVAFRLRDSRDSIQGTHVSAQSIRGWLPGLTEVEVRYPVPDKLSQGAYTLELGLVFHNAPDRIVPIANEGKTADGWYVIGAMEIE
jgi:hypothetical protein